MRSSLKSQPPTDNLANPSYVEIAGGGSEEEEKILPFISLMLSGQPERTGSVVLGRTLVLAYEKTTTHTQ